MKLTEKKLMLLTIGIPCIICLGLGAVWYWAYHQNSGLKTTIKENNQKIKEAEETVGQMLKLGDEIADLEKKRAENETLFPNKEEMSLEYFINTLTRLSTEANVHLSNAQYDQGSFGGPKAPGIFDRIGYRLSLEGSFFDLMYFVYLLESYQRFIKVDKFSLHPRTGQKTDTPNYGMEISITSYTYNKHKKQ